MEITSCGSITTQRWCLFSNKTNFQRKIIKINEFKSKIYVKLNKTTIFILLNNKTKHMKTNKLIIFALIAIITISCKSSTKSNTKIKSESNTSTFKGSLVAKPGEVAITVANTVKVDFVKDKAILNFENLVDTLDIYRTGSGYGYAKNGIDLRGKGVHATLTMPDGRIISLTDDTVYFERELSMDNCTFEVIVIGETLTITPLHPIEITKPFTHDMIGWSIAGTAIADLNNDYKPELLIYLVSDGSGSYGEVICYSVNNNGKSVSQVYFPPTSQSDSIKNGYMGHDIFDIVNNNLVQVFPIYKDGDSNAQPTGGKREVIYELKNSNNIRKFEIKTVIDKL